MRFPKFSIRHVLYGNMTLGQDVLPTIQLPLCSTFLLTIPAPG